eukprot:scaffold1498_cov180-Ochromonas_danica.AAC.12
MKRHPLDDNSACNCKNKPYPIAALVGYKNCTALNITTMKTKRERELKIKLFSKQHAEAKANSVNDWEITSGFVIHQH